MALYVYALSDSAADSFECRNRRIEFVAAGGVFAAVSRAAARLPLTEASLRDQHEIVAEIAGRVEALVPARFGSLVEPGELDRIVELRREAIAEALLLVRGREQMTIRLFAVPAAAPPEPQQPATSGTAFLEQRKAAAEWSLPPRVDAVRGLIRHLVAAERTVRGEGRVQATIYHLIARGTAAEYSERLERARPDFPDVPYIVSGPWPPFAFAPELWA